MPLYTLICIKYTAVPTENMQNYVVWTPQECGNREHILYVYTIKGEKMRKSIKTNLMNAFLYC